MTYSQDAELQQSLLKTQRTCKVIKIVSIVCLAIFAIFWLLLLTTQVVASLKTGFDAIALLHSILLGACIMTVLGVFAQIFSDALKCRSPFTRRQSLRLVIIAISLLMLACNDILFPVSQSYDAIILNQHIGFEVNTGGAPVSPMLNVGMLFFSILLLCLSVIFRYGYLLQQLNDETV